MKTSSMLVIGGLKGAIQNNFTNTRTKTYPCSTGLGDIRYAGEFLEILCLFVSIRG
jgi:hypothetical protein